ncbi:sialic acid-binding Ig-like lectin 14 [Haliotis rubra]|uniref:sialic acid-binding Ig-like lectin 14 n=1 Tax=Haliotis rubra TaxID=36100 RepID=UPI001EE4FEA1|nr:sialic acid-binding Ig-like lectin 14 [Haliotis rubra]
MQCEKHQDSSGRQQDSVTRGCQVPTSRPPYSPGFHLCDVCWSPKDHPVHSDGGNPLADITWSCYNTSNTDSESSSGGTKTSSLTFLVTKLQNSRRCQCQATWIYGGYDETVTQTFTVYYPPDKPTTTNPGTLCQGRATSLTCSSSPDHGNPPATFYWTKNSIAVHTGSSYTFSPVKADNGADIRCAAGNTYTDRAGSSRPQSNARQLSVYYVGAPSITPAATQTRKEGESLVLSHVQLMYATRLGGDVIVSVSVLAYPLPSFTWSRSISTSQDLTGSSSPVSDISVTARLHLTNLQEQDFGDYSLTVDNGVGESVTYTVNIVPSVGECGHERRQE